MKEYLRQIRCNCGNEFELFGRAEYKCECGQTWITSNDAFLSYRNTGGFGENFETLSQKEYLSDDSGLINPDVIAIYEKCKEKAQNIGFYWWETTTTNRNSGNDIVDYICATFDIPLKNKIEENQIEFTLSLDNNNHDEYLKRFASFLILLDELEKKELDFSSRATSNKQNAFHMLCDKNEAFDFDAREESLSYKNIKFYV